MCNYNLNIVYIEIYINWQFFSIMIWIIIAL